MSDSGPSTWEKASVAIAALALAISALTAWWTIRSGSEVTTQERSAAARDVALFRADPRAHETLAAEEVALKVAAKQGKVLRWLLVVENRGSRPVADVLVSSSGLGFAQRVSRVGACSARYVAVVAPTKARSETELDELVVAFRDFDGRMWTRDGLTPPKEARGSAATSSLAALEDRIGGPWPSAGVSPTTNASLEDLDHQVALPSGC